MKILSTSFLQDGSLCALRSIGQSKKVGDSPDLFRLRLFKAFFGGLEGRTYDWDFRLKKSAKELSLQISSSRPKWKDFILLILVAGESYSRIGDTTSDDCSYSLCNDSSFRALIAAESDGKGQRHGHASLTLEILLLACAGFVLLWGALFLQVGFLGFGLALFWDASGVGVFRFRERKNTFRLWG